MGVGAGAATFKAVALASLLARRDLRVRVLMTQASLAFATPLAFTAVTGEDVVTTATHVDADGVATHLRVAESDALVIVPATADLIAKVAHGFGDDAVTLGALCAPDVRLFCPAMNDRMWHNAVVAENVARLEASGWQRIGPVHGRLAEGYDADGRMAEPEAIVEAVVAAT